MAIEIVKQLKFALPLLISMSIAGSCNAATVKTSYQNSSEIFPNPERGFYFSSNPNWKNQVVPLQLSELQKLRSEGVTLVRRYYALVGFHNKPIPQAFLDTILNDCQLARQAGVKLIVVFGYNWLGGGPDAPADRVVSHLDQLKPIFQTNYDVIAYMMAGFIGNWGEWHDSSNNLVEPWTLIPSNGAKQIVNKILSVLPSERMVVFRYAKHKKMIFNNDNALTPTEAFNGSNRARSGHDNAGFRASIDDGGTYGHTDPAIVEQEKSWLNLDTRYVVQGGEPAWPSDPPQYDDCPGTLTDLARMHWSAMAMNNGDAQAVYQGWKDQGCMNDIKRRLGYRFRLIDSYLPDKVKPGGSFSMSFNITNDGWASPYNPRNLEVILRHRQTGKEFYLPVAEAVRMWMPGETKKVTLEGGIPTSMPAGEYQAFLNLPDPSVKISKRPEFSIRLANQNVWEASTGYNSLLRNVIVDSNAAGGTYSGSQFFKSR